MKFEDIKRKVILESAVIVAALCVLGAAGFGLDYLADTYLSESAALNTEVSASGAQLTALREKYMKVQKNAFLYDEVSQKSANNMLSIDREFIRKKIDDFKNRFSLSDFHLTVSPSHDIGDKKGKFNVLTASDASLTFHALSDEDVYKFAEALQTELPGMIRVLQFDVKREAAPLDAGLRSVIQTGKFPFVSCTIKFTWFGLRTLDTSAATPPASAQGKP